MIGRIRGEIIDRTSTTIVVDVGGVGYLLTVSVSTHFRVGEKVDLHVYTHVREDTLQLFGFASALEREVFYHLIAVPNVGPVKAMGILATPAEDIIRLVAERNPVKLAKLPGVGKKTAERLLVDLADRLETLLPQVRSMSEKSPSSEDPSSSKLDDLVSALVNLGFKPGAAEEAAKSALARLGPNAQLAALMKEAIASVSR